MTAGAWNTRPWNGFVLGFIVAVMTHLTAASDAGRIAEPWPTLLSSEAAGIDPEFAALQQRAHVALENLVQSAPTPEQML